MPRCAAAPVLETCQDVCEAYRLAPARAAAGSETRSIDEMTGVQALERAAPTLPMRPGRAELREYEYVRYGALTLIAAFDVVTGKVIYRIGPTRTEQDFAPCLAELFAQRDDDTRWHLIIDNLNIHCSEAVVRLVAAASTATSASKASTASSSRWPRARASCATPAIASSSTSRPSTPRGSTRSRCGFPSSRAKCSAAATSPPSRISNANSPPSLTISTRRSPSRFAGPTPASRSRLELQMVSGLHSRAADRCAHCTWLLRESLANLRSPWRPFVSLAAFEAYEAL
jgi:hypothetical protein